MSLHVCVHIVLMLCSCLLCPFLCVHIVSMFVCSQASIMGNPLVTTQVTLVTVSCQLVKMIFLAGHNFEDRFLLINIIFVDCWAAEDKRLPVASDSPGVTDSYDAAVDSVDV